ncbi:hypothetical protein GUITHDRAFT_119422 [Guillardia theta CCMP2712]|uniref:ZU5 domain-containing protein n=2 Tax=Guillardia theta (strain CCMP2712) TaxID=905079 RepID=L1IEA4_GUITC|nr:hypothetical protein GUITHDRAFT_119422 [Guillardia theta CCMP2712]EKX34417.1 hypothetical protein GUITHDRAFT_119422 [Guillardia theta CCMP2712]|eukprot:XP_005821397.1 hypothetical protein GUITHDRAFT_119422 [Guillardia theta CCMP2712]
MTEHLSLCTWLATPQWTGLSVLSGSQYATMLNQLTILLTSNFPLKVGSNFSIIGLNVTIDGNPDNVSVSGNDILSYALWSDTAGKLTVFVKAEVNSTSFTVQVVNPSYGRDPITLGAVCSDCVSFAPSYLVYNANLTSGLATVALAPSSCGKDGQGIALYGSDCQYKCYGVVTDKYCVCNAGQFGPGCSQSLGTPSQVQTKSIPPGEAASISGSGGLSVSLPAGALLGSQTISVAVYDVSNLNLSQGTTETLVPAGPVIIFTPAGLRFKKPITIRIPYNPDKIPANLRPYVFYYNSSSLNPWERQISTPRPNATPPVLEALIDHFSGFTPLGANPPSNSDSSSPASSSTAPAAPPTYTASSSASGFAVRLQVVSPMSDTFFSSNSDQIKQALAEGLRLNVADVNSPTVIGYVQRRSNQSLSFSADLKVDNPLGFVESVQANASQTLTRLNVAFSQRSIPDATSFSISLIPPPALSSGAIAGIAIGSVGAGLVLVAIGWMVYKERKRRNVEKRYAISEPPAQQAAPLPVQESPVSADGFSVSSQFVVEPTFQNQGFHYYRWS